MGQPRGGDAREVRAVWGAGPETVADRLAVLVSGGLDSAILVADAASQGDWVQPLYIRSGLAWEPAELAHLKRYLKTIGGPRIGPLSVLTLPMDDLLAGHWSVTGAAVPGLDSVDEEVYLPGRNVILLAKALLWCRLNGVSRLALGVLRSNPFPDATPAFFNAFATVVSGAIGGSLTIERPYQMLSKREVMKRGSGLPLELSFSCINPVDGQHCGACNKCAERRDAFRAAGIPDRTLYASEHESSQPA